MPPNIKEMILTAVNNLCLASTLTLTPSLSRVISRTVTSLSSNVSYSALGIDVETDADTPGFEGAGVEAMAVTVVISGVRSLRE